MSRGDGRGQSRQPCPHPRHGKPSRGRERFRAAGCALGGCGRGAALGLPARSSAQGQGHGSAGPTCATCARHRPPRHDSSSPYLLPPLLPPALANRAPSSSGREGERGEGVNPALPSPPGCRFPSPLSPARAARRSGRLSPALQTAPTDGKRDPPPAASFP